MTKRMVVPRLRPRRALHRLEINMAGEKAMKPKYRVTIEELNDDPKEGEDESTVMAQFSASHVDYQHRKGDCIRVFATSDNCTSCLIIRRDMQKESTR